MTKNEIGPVPSFYQGYIEKVEDNDLILVLQDSLVRLHTLNIDNWKYLHGQSYFPGKWTLNELIQHIIDTERIMGYRALCIARGEKQPLPGYDENAYAALSEANERTIPDLCREWIIVRQSTIELFRSFNSSTLKKEGIANQNTFSVAALGYIIAGHEQHHLEIIRQLYLPLL